MRCRLLLAGLPLTLFALSLSAGQPPPGGDWPMFGGTPGRNMVNPVAKNVPTEWAVEDGKQKNVKWVAALGNKAYGGPVTGGGRVFIGTNNGNPRDPKVKGPKGIVMAFDEKTGKFLWQAVHDMPAPDVVRDAQTDGMCSTP